MVGEERAGIAVMETVGYGHNANCRYGGRRSI